MHLADLRSNANGREDLGYVPHLYRTKRAGPPLVDEPANAGALALAGLGPTHHKIGGRVLYRMDVIEAYEEASARSSTSTLTDAAGARRG
jgi:hypothetical protein